MESGLLKKILVSLQTTLRYYLEISFRKFESISHRALKYQVNFKCCIYIVMKKTSLNVCKGRKKV